MLDLIARLEAAKEGERVLDAAIAVATGVVWKDADPSLVENAVVCPDDPDWINYEYQGEECTDIALSFTSSIDAALTLVGNRWYRLERSCDGGFFAQVAEWHVNTETVKRQYAFNQATALCIAAMKARHAISVPSNVRPGESAGDGVSSQNQREDK